jgi:hypothetical protein
MKNAKEIIQVSINEALQIMLNVVGHPFSFWSAFTEPSLSGGKAVLAQFGGAVYKFASYTLVANREYNRSIELACEKYGKDFSAWKPQAHNYATHIGGNILTHNNDLQLPLESSMRRNYAQFMLHKGCQVESQYFDAEIKPIAFETIKPYLKAKTSKKQEEIGLSKEEQIPCINFGMGSIKQFTLNGQKYEIVAD